MNSKQERASEIARAAITPRLPFIRSYAIAHQGQRKRIELGYGNGAKITLEFHQLASILALVEPPEGQQDPCADPATVVLRVGNQTKLHFVQRGVDVDLVSFFPGPWERMFGVDDAGDTQVLLPPVLR